MSSARRGTDRHRRRRLRVRHPQDIPGRRQNTVLLWDLADPAQPRRLADPLTGHTRPLTGVAFAPDGRTLATASGDATVLLWALSGLDALRADPMERACSVTGRGLNADEWSRSVPDLAYVDSFSR